MYSYEKLYRKKKLSQKIDNTTRGLSFVTTAISLVVNELVQPSIKKEGTTQKRPHDGSMGEDGTSMGEDGTFVDDGSVEDDELHNIHNNHDELLHNNQSTNCSSC